MKIFITLLLLLAMHTYCYSQKTAPVAGHAARLVDLLKKDYSSLDVTSRNETMLNDMEEVLATFRVYTGNEYPKNFQPADISVVNPLSSDNHAIEYQVNTIENEYGLYIGAVTAYNNISKTLAAVSVSSTSATGYGSPYAEFSRLNAEMLIAKKNYEREKLKETTNQFLILRNYFKEANPYLSYMLELFVFKYDQLKTFGLDIYSKANYTSSIQKALPFFGGDLAFKEAIDGLSKFLAKRIKDELTTYAVQKVQEYLNNPKPESYLNELMVLLPVTTSYLKSFDSTRTLNFINDLKQYIEQDLNNLMDNAPNLKNTPRFKSYIKMHPDLDFAFEALELIPQIQKLENPIDYFDILENSRNIQRWGNINLIDAAGVHTALVTENNVLKFNISNSIKFASMIAHSLVVVENNKPRFASTAFISAYSSEVNFYMLYLGFLKQQNKKFYNVSYYMNPNIKTLEVGLKNLMTTIITPAAVTASEKKYQIISSNMIQIATNAERLNTSFNDIKKTNSAKEKVTAEQIHDLTGNIIDFAEEVIRVIDTLATDEDLKLFDSATNGTIAKTTKPYFITARTVNNIFLDLHTKSYTTALVKAIEIPLAFAKDNSQSRVYNSIISVVNNTKDIQQLYNLKKLLSYDRVYTDIEKLENQQNLGLWIKIALESNPNLTTYAAKYVPVYESLKNNDKDGTFNTDLKAFEDLIKNNNIIFYKEYAGIDIYDILNNVENLLIKHNITNVNVKNDIRAAIKNAIENTIKYYVYDEKDKNEQRREDIKLMIQNFKYYMPEVFPDVFEFKDENTIKLIHFVNDVANAENAEDVEKALNAFALPPGSSSLKEHTYSYYSINSYPGLFGGITSSDFNGAKETYTTGITAPIGFYFQPWPAGAKVTWGIYVPIIDIAAPVRLRLNGDNDTEVLPDFDFMDIFSPGIYFSLGFNKSPFALNIGGQFGPRLKALSSDTSSTDGGNSAQQIVNEKQVFYFGIGAVIDIPLFTLFARSQN